MPCSCGKNYTELPVASSCCAALCDYRLFVLASLVMKSWRRPGLVRKSSWPKQSIFMTHFHSHYGQTERAVLSFCLICYSNTWKAVSTTLSHARLISPTSSSQGWARSLLAFILCISSVLSLRLLMTVWEHGFTSKWDSNHFFFSAHTTQKWLLTHWCEHTHQINQFRLLTLFKCGDEYGTYLVLLSAVKIFIQN